MSNWTHVAGIIRVDSVLGPEVDWDILLGKELVYGEEYGKWAEADEYPKLFMPFGSEGSLHKNVWTNPNKRHMARYTVSIFGDLRDHDDPDAIIKWFQNKCAGLYVRQASIVVSNERNGDREWHINAV